MKIAVFQRFSGEVQYFIKTGELIFSARRVSKKAKHKSIVIVLLNAAKPPDRSVLVAGGRKT